MGDPWGVLAPIEDTIWGTLLPKVPSEEFTHALYGHAMPLIRLLGPFPGGLARQVPEEEGRCRRATNKACTLASAYCRPGKKIPDCYEAPGENSELKSDVALAWAEGRYVIIVLGDEFVL